MRKPTAIQEYPLVVRKVLENLVISIPDLNIWRQIPAPPKISRDGKTVSEMNDEYCLMLGRSIKAAWISAHQHVSEKKWVPEASNFKQSLQKADKDYSVPAFTQLLNKYMSVCENTIRREIKRGVIKCYQTKGGHRRIPASELEIYLDKSKDLPTSFEANFEKENSNKLKNDHPL
ncbi:MAG: helix-turn-helix domain-containing protein [Pseudobdellovibrio sp.]